ncbi:MAG: hypothetical protein WED34_18375, partial [Planctomycetales bacterium]
SAKPCRHNEMPLNFVPFSFELFRHSLGEVQLITFDELFSKVQAVVDIIEGNSLGSTILPDRFGGGPTSIAP